ncbi:MAG: hypothetical protein KAT65_27630 [Methanophagales archaeon]|nr:hypothetical protein [Methanophagales archaeon]
MVFYISYTNTKNLLKIQKLPDFLCSLLVQCYISAVRCHIFEY